MCITVFSVFLLSRFVFLSLKMPADGHELITARVTQWPPGWQTEWEVGKQKEVVEDERVVEEKEFEDQRKKESYEEENDDKE